MSIRRAIVEADLDGLNVTEFCRQHGVSTWLFYQLRRRYRQEGEASLEPRPPIAKLIANRTPVWVEDAIVDLRKELADLGLDAGAATIAFHLPVRLGPEVTVPSEATIWRILTRRGFIVPDPKKAPKHSHRSFSAERANECWQIDDTEWSLRDGTAVKIINIVDDCTRVAVASKAVMTCSTAAAFDAFVEGADRWGWPARFLSDNAKAFRHGLTEALHRLGIGAGHSRPYHPQTCGKVERVHQTLKRFLSRQPPAATLGELQDQLDRFIAIYNHQRPHRSLGRRIPAEVHAATPKSGPADRSLGTPTTIHQVKVSNGNCYIGRRYTIAVTAAYTGAAATVIITGTACHIFINGQLIRQLTLDPARRSQPIYHRRGRPITVREGSRHP
ncbi:MAG: integrase core domain-containing protein [Acidimicrobiia bacterium]